MNEQMGKELNELLTAYLSNWRTLRDCYIWLSSVDWDDPDWDADVKSMLGMLELLATDALKGFRNEIEFAQEASDFVAKKTGTRYAVPESPTEISIAASSSASNVSGTLLFIGVQAERSWNISPLTVSV